MLPSMLKLKEKYGLYIDGKWKDASDNAVIKTYCPATGDFLADCADASKDDVDLAVKAAYNDRNALLVFDIISHY